MNTLLLILAPITAGLASFTVSYLTVSAVLRRQRLARLKARD